MKRYVVLKLVFLAPARYTIGAWSLRSNTQGALKVEKPPIMAAIRGPPITEAIHALTQQPWNLSSEPERTSIPLGINVGGRRSGNFMHGDKYPEDIAKEAIKKGKEVQAYLKSLSARMAKGAKAHAAILNSPIHSPQVPDGGLAVFPPAAVTGPHPESPYTFANEQYASKEVDWNLPPQERMSETDALFKIMGKEWSPGREDRSTEWYLKANSIDVPHSVNSLDVWPNPNQHPRVQSDADAPSVLSLSFLQH